MTLSVFVSGRIFMRIMAVDHGDVRTGVAVCDKGEMLASPVKTIRQTDQEKLADEIAELAKEYRAEMFVVGLSGTRDEQL